MGPLRPDAPDRRRGPTRRPVVSAACFASAAAAGVIVLAIAATEISLSAASWLLLAASLVVGTVPFALLGIALGFLATPKAALPLANVLYLSLAYLGALWTDPDELPRIIGGVSILLPTREWADLLRAAAGNASIEVRDVAALAAWTLAFAYLAVRAYRRDEGARFR